MRSGFFSSIFLVFFSTAVCFGGLLETYESLDRVRSEKASFTQAELKLLYERTSTHPVASLDVLDKYDTPAGEIGFCFGRAMAAHLLAKKMNLNASSISKLFIVGDLKGEDGSQWRFHVTTLVRGKRGQEEGWYAIDPVMGRPLTMEQWIAEVTQGWDRKEAAYFYWVPRDAVVPDIRKVPAPKDETGEHLIELSFDPSKLKGFSAVEVGDRVVYRVGDDPLNEQFLLAQKHPTQQFDFEGITIGGRRFPYKNYFVDLFAELSKSGFRDLRERHLSVTKPRVALGLRQ